ncbi:MAG TPA: DUF4013 domain-containing protein [Anaerolineaceae bacterium]|nr:DUF4013 domain-containing protein [Anaerolineaceae bacterium]HPN50395.1 DUF4013 domain-containing protein [Anaerolineaceae bacterium]
MSTDSLQQILMFPFRGNGWQGRFAVACLLMLGNYVIPIIPVIFLAGYLVEIMRRVILDGRSPELPDWSDFGGFGLRGIKALGAAFILNLPSAIFIMAGLVLSFMPSLMVPFIDRFSRDATGLIVFLMLAMMATMFVMFGIGMLFSLLIGAFMPVSLNHLAAKDSFLAAFNIGEWWKVMRANLSGYFLAWLVVMGLYMVAMFAMQILYFTVILCCLLPIVMSVIYTYMGMVAAALFASAYREGQSRLTFHLPADVDAPAA